MLLDGRQVVVKVQHGNVAAQLLQDLQNLETIGETIRYLDPDFDFSPVVREWAKEVPKELDFRCEAKNMHRVTENLSKSYRDGSIDVTLAEVIPELVTEKVSAAFIILKSRNLIALYMHILRLCDCVFSGIGYDIH